MLSARDHAEIVAHYLADELKAGRIAVAGTTREALGLEIHCSPFGVIPKKNKPGLILNLSAPENHSVNDGISKELASLSYMTVDEVAETVQRLSSGTLMAKMDIRQTYRNIPVHPLDRRLLGMLWKGKVYIDTTLQFILRSDPLIFTAIADAEQWIMQQKGASHVFHYIDDWVHQSLRSVWKTTQLCISV